MCKCASKKSLRSFLKTFATLESNTWINVHRKLYVDYLLLKLTKFSLSVLYIPEIKKEFSLRTPLYFKTVPNLNNTSKKMSLTRRVLLTYKTCCFLWFKQALKHLYTSKNLYTVKCFQTYSQTLNWLHSIIQMRDDTINSFMIINQYNLNSKLDDCVSISTIFYLLSF